jgi:large subunit ribosomal protein L10
MAEVINSNPVAHVSENKKQMVNELAEQMKRKTVMIISIKGLPSAQFQDIKKKLRGRARIMVAKKSLINFALDHSGIKKLHGLVKYVDDSSAILFSDEDTFEISGILSDEKSPAKAKAGQIAPSNIEVKSGPTELLPGPKVESGKISIMQDKVIVRKGAEITPALASIMAKLDIIPFEVGVEPVAAYMDGEVYVDIKIDKEGTFKELIKSFGRSLAFSVEIGYVCDENLDYILGRAGIEERVLEGLLEAGGNKTEEEEDKSEVKKDETSVEETKNDGGENEKN